MESMQFSSVKVLYTEEDPSIVDSYIVTTNGRTLGVPVDPYNRHYKAILEWLAEGNTPLPADT